MILHQVEIVGLSGDTPVIEIRCLTRELCDNADHGCVGSELIDNPDLLPDLEGAPPWTVAFIEDRFVEAEPPDAKEEFTITVAQVEKGWGPGGVLYTASITEPELPGQEAAGYSEGDTVPEALRHLADDIEQLALKAYTAERLNLPLPGRDLI